MRKIPISDQFEMLSLRVADYAAAGKLHLTVEDLLADFRGQLHDCLEAGAVDQAMALANETRGTIRFLESLPAHTTVYEFLLPRIAEG